MMLLGMLRCGALEELLQPLFGKRRTDRLGLQRARLVTPSVHGEESWNLRWNRPNCAFNARWTHASLHGFGMGLCLGSSGYILGRLLGLRI